MEDKRLDTALDRLYKDAQVPDDFDTAWRAALRREEQQLMNKPTFSFSWRRLIPVLAAVVLLVGGFAAGRMTFPGEMQNNTIAPPMMSMKRSASVDYDGMSYEESSYGMGMQDMPTMYADQASGTNGATALEAVDQRKLVRTADLTVRTQQFDQAQEQITALLSEMGGYVENLYQYNDGDMRRLTLNLRVPSGRLDVFLAGLSGTGRVTNRSESTVDKTTQYADNAARLGTLYAKRDRLNDLLLKAEDVEDLIYIENAIADTQYQIDSYESTQRTIDRQVDMSAVSIQLIEDTPAEAAQADISLGQRLSNALNASLKGLLNFSRNLLVFVTMLLPVLVIAGVVVLIVRAIRKRKAK